MTRAKPLLLNNNRFRCSRFNERVSRVAVVAVAVALAVGVVAVVVDGRPILATVIKKRIWQRTQENTNIKSNWT